MKLLPKTKTILMKICMCILVVGFAFIFTNASSSLSSTFAAEPTTTKPTILAKEIGPVTGSLSNPCEVRKLKTTNGICITVLDSHGHPIWTSQSLGEQDKTFMLDDKPTTLALKDINGDKLPEILASAFIGPQSSGLYIFRYDASAKKFVSIPCRFPKENLERDCLISDVNQESGGDLMIKSDGTAQVLGMIYPDNADADDLPTPGIWTFTYQSGAFVHQKTEKLPPPPDN